MNCPELIDYVEGEIERVAKLYKSAFTTGGVERDLLFLSKVAEFLGLEGRASELKLKSKEYGERYKIENEDLDRRHLDYKNFWCQGGEVFYDTDHFILDASESSRKYKEETKGLLAPLENIIKLLEDAKEKILAERVELC